MEDTTTKDSVYGPAIVSVANGFRAFDAPVRYPLLFSSPGFSFATMYENPMALPRGSSFITLIEHFIGFIVLLPILLYKRGGIKHFLNILKSFDKRDWISVIYISFGGSAMGLFFFLIAFGLGNPTIAILIQKSQPLITLAFAFFILKEKPTFRYYVALILAIIGIMLIATPDIIKSSQTLEYTGLIAILCSLIAAFFWGGSTVFGRILTKKVDFWDLTLFRYTGGFTFLLFFNIALWTYSKDYFGMLTTKINVFGHFIAPGEPFQPFDIQWLGISAIIYFALLTGGVIPLAIYYFGLKRSKASVAGIAELAFPLLAIFINYYFLGFGLETIQIIGASLLFITVSTLSYINAKEMERANALKAEENKAKMDNK